MLKEQYEPVASTAREDFKVRDAEDTISTTLTDPFVDPFLLPSPQFHHFLNVSNEMRSFNEDQDDEDQDDQNN